MDSISGNLNTHISLSQMQGKSLFAKPAAEEGDDAGKALQGFGSVLKEQMNQINNLQAQADEASQTYALGGDIELHNVILATDKAELSLQFATQVRNKILSAYQDIIKMPI